MPVRPVQFGLVLFVQIFTFQCTSILYRRLELPVQSVPITTKVVSSNPTHDEVYLCDKVYQ